MVFVAIREERTKDWKDGNRTRDDGTSTSEEKWVNFSACRLLAGRPVLQTRQGMMPVVYIFLPAR
jgi:hypothetical protein